MIKTFTDKATQKLFEEGASKKIPQDLQRRALIKLTLIDKAIQVEDLLSLPSNRLHKLQGDRADQWSISVNERWHICFMFQDGDAYDVELCDYH